MVFVPFLKFLFLFFFPQVQQSSRFLSSSRHLNAPFPWLQTTPELFGVVLKTMDPQRFKERVSSDELDLDSLRLAAADFYRVNGVPAVIERALNELFLRQPEDVHGHLVGSRWK